MSRSNRDPIPTLCRKRIAALRRSSPGCLIPSVDRVIQIVQCNLNTERFHRFAAGRSQSSPLTLANYVDIVLLHVSREHDRIDALEKGDAIEWERLREFLARRAYRSVQRFRNGADVWEEALDFAHETCMVIFDERYPFDVSFEAWATTILKNLILNRYTRATDVLDRSDAPESLDASRVSDNGAVSTLGELFADRQSLAPFEKIENQTILLDAIAQLQSPAQRQVIQDTFLRELDDAQVAHRLGKSRQAVYNLRHRALAQLKRILTHQIPSQEKDRKTH